MEAPSGPLAAALRFMKVRPRSVREVGDKLQKIGVEGAEAEKILARLRSEGLLDDGRFALWWAEDRALTGKAGPLKVRAELEARGLAGDLIDRTLETAFPNDRIREILASQIKSLRGRNPSRLVRLGFDPELVEEMLGRDATL